MYVCMYVCNTITLESLDVESSFFDHSLHLTGIRVKFVYEGHRIKEQNSAIIPVPAV